MCLASKFLTRFEELTCEMETEYQRLKKLEHLYNEKLSNFYHQMETAKFNAVEGYYKAKEIQDIVRQRRVIKDEIYRLKCVRDKMKLTAIIERSKATRDTLNDIHKHREEHSWSNEWADDYRIEDLQIH